MPTDAHALNHMMDHNRECKKYDPQGNYVRRWLPVLARLPVEYIHTCALIHYRPKDLHSSLSAYSKAPWP